MTFLQRAAEKVVVNYTIEMESGTLSFFVNDSWIGLPQDYPLLLILEDSLTRHN